MYVLRVAKIALFGKLWFECRLVRLDNVCNVHWITFSKLPNRAKEGRGKQNKFLQVALTYQRALTCQTNYLFFIQFCNYLSSCTVLSRPNIGCHF